MGSFEVRVPASTANLGPGFDALACALSLSLAVTDGGPGAEESHPAVVAFRGAGGRGPLTVTTTFPGGRGLGYSGAARVAGLVAAACQAGARDVRELRDDVVREAARLEGHGDNVAASVHGGVVAVADGHAVRVPLALEPAVVVWIPSSETSTSASRRRLPGAVPFEDATFNVAHAALLVAALAAGDVGALREAAKDRLHQDRRLEDAPDTRAAIDAALEAGAWSAWLSGSGPSAAAFCAREWAAAIAAALPSGGRTLVCDVDTEGAVIR